MENNFFYCSVSHISFFHPKITIGTKSARH